MALIGIICSLWAEAKPLLSWDSHPQVYKYKRHSWIRLTWQNHQIIVVVGKVGNAQASKATHLLIEHHNPQLIINFGSAGAISSDVKIGEVVVGTETTEYLQAPPESCLIASDLELLKVAQFFPQIRLGPIVSADQNIENEVLKNELFERYQAICGDWESAIIMKICQEFQIKAIPFRVITDLGNEEALLDFEKYHEKVLVDAAHLLKRFLERWRVMQ